jgi:uncharacterized membrane protein YqhA
VGTIDFMGLKLKLMSSIVAISTIQVLKTFMNVGNISDRDITWHIVMHRLRRLGARDGAHRPGERGRREAHRQVDLAGRLRRRPPGC